MATVGDQGTLEWLEDTIALIELNRSRTRIVQEARLPSTSVCRQHFEQWDTQVFMQGPIFHSVSFPPDSDITDSEVYLFVAVHGAGQALCLYLGDFTMMEVSMPLYNQW